MKSRTLDLDLDQGLRDGVGTMHDRRVLIIVGVLICLGCGRESYRQTAAADREGNSALAMERAGAADAPTTAGDQNLAGSPGTSESTELGNASITEVAGYPSGLLLPGVSLDGLDVRFGRTSLPQIVAELGHGAIVDHGEAGDYVATLCYRSAGHPAVVLLINSDVMGGDTHDVTDFVLASEDRIDNAPQSCSTLAVGPDGFEVIGSGLKIGSTVEALRRLLGEPDSTLNGRWYYSAEVPIHENGEEVGEVYATVQAVFRGDSLRELRARENVAF